MWSYFEEYHPFVILDVDPTSGPPTYRSLDEFTGWLDYTLGES